MYFGYLSFYYFQIIISFHREPIVLIAQSGILHFFDLDVVIPDPSTSGDTLNQALWLEFFMVAGGIHEVIVDDQESKQCLNFYDGQMAVINQWEGSQYTYGSTSPSLPPDPGTFEMDYYLTGSLGKSANSKAYAILVNIYSGDGDVVASTTNIYNFSVSGIQN